jgi:hypothetical protein
MRRFIRLLFGLIIFVAGSSTICGQDEDDFPGKGTFGPIEFMNHDLPKGVVSSVDLVNNLVNEFNPPHVRIIASGPNRIFVVASPRTQWAISKKLATLAREQPKQKCGAEPKAAQPDGPAKPFVGKLEPGGHDVPKNSAEAVAQKLHKEIKDPNVLILVIGRSRLYVYGPTDAHDYIAKRMTEMAKDAQPEPKKKDAQSKKPLPH